MRSADELKGAYSISLRCLCLFDADCLVVCKLCNCRETSVVKCTFFKRRQNSIYLIEPDVILGTLIEDIVRVNSLESIYILAGK